MSKGKLLYALEGVEMNVKNDEENGDFLIAGQLEVMICERDIDGHFGEFNEMNNDVDEVTSSIERLGGISTAILTHGISAPMMEAADPNGELVAAGICCSYESLEVIPTQDYNAESTVGYIVDMVEESKKGFLKNTLDKVTGKAGAARDALKAKGDKIIGDVKSGQTKRNLTFKKDKAVGGVQDKVIEHGGSAGDAIAGGAEKAGKAIAGAGKAVGDKLSAIGYNKKFVAGAMATVAALFIAAAAVVMTKLVGAFISWLKSYKSLLEGTLQRVKAAGSLDNGKFEGMSVTAYHEGDFKRAVKAAEHITSVVNSGKLTELAGEMESVLGSADLKIEKVHAITKKAGDYLKSIASNQDVSEICGLAVTVGETGFSVGTKTPEIRPASESAGKLGWKVDHVHSALEDALRLANVSEGTAKHVEAAAKQCDKIAKELRGEKNKEFSEEEKAAYKQAIKDLREVVSANKVVFQLTSTAVRNICASAVAVGKAASKCGSGGGAAEGGEGGEA